MCKVFCIYIKILSRKLVKSRDESSSEFFKTVHFSFNAAIVFEDNSVLWIVWDVTEKNKGNLVIKALILNYS